MTGPTPNKFAPEQHSFEKPVLRNVDYLQIVPLGNDLTIIAVDPGGVSGWSRLTFPKKIGNQDFWLSPMDKILSQCLWVHGQIDCKDIEYGAYQLRKLVDETPDAAIVFESFFIRQMAVDLSPIELISVVRHHLWMKGRVMHMQQPAMAKSLTNDRLKTFGVYTSEGGLQHARDADRHALMMLRRCMDKNGPKMRKVLWPHVFG